MGSVPIMHAALPFCSATDNLWNRNVGSRLSPVTAEMRSPSSYKKSVASEHQLPVTSQASGMKMLLRASSSYFLVFKAAARSAAEPASSDVMGR